MSVETRPADVAGMLRLLAILGFERVDPPPGLRGRAVWAQSARTQVHLLLTDDPVAPPRGHFAVVAADYEPTLEALRAAGFDPEPRAEHWGSPRCFVRGPGGHRVEVMAEPPA